MTTKKTSILLQEFLKNYKESTGIDAASKCRKRIVTYSRVAITHVISKQLSLGCISIGKLLKQQHDVILYYQKKHSILSKYEDYSDILKTVKKEWNVVFKAKKNGQKNKIVKVAGVPFEVSYNIVLGEPSTHDYPGYDDKIEIESLECEGVDFREFLADFPDLETKILDILNDD